MILTTQLDLVMKNLRMKFFQCNSQNNMEEFDNSINKMLKVEIFPKKHYIRSNIIPQEMYSKFSLLALVKRNILIRNILILKIVICNILFKIRTIKGF